MPTIRVGIPSLGVVALALLLAGCASAPQAPTLYAVAGNRLAMITPRGHLAALGRDLRAVEPAALAHDPDSGTFYALRTHAAGIELWKLSSAHGKPRRVAAVTLDADQLARLDTLVWDRARHRLLAGGSVNKESVFSDLLFAIDPETGRAQRLGPVWTSQRDVDGLAFVDAELIVLEVAAGRSTFYSLDLVSGETSRLGQISAALDAIAWDPATRILLGLDAKNHQLQRLDVDSGGATMAAEPLDLSPAASPLGALTVAVPARWQGAPRPTVHSDGFESGDARHWSSRVDPEAPGGR